MKRLKNGKIILDVEETEYLKNSYPFCENRAVAEYLGICSHTMLQMAKRLGLKKDENYRRWHRFMVARTVNRIKTIRGTHPPKGKPIPRSEEHRFKKGESNEDRYGEERSREIYDKARKTRNDNIRRDRIRRKYGLKPITNIYHLGQCEPRKITMWRRHARERGYIAGRGSMTVYYDDNTKRGVVFEENGSKHGFTILRKGCVAEKKVVMRVVENGLANISFV